MTWHAETATLARYAEGAVDAVTAASVEAHLARCSQCRAELVPYADTSRLDRTWREVLDVLDTPRTTFAERVLRLLRVRDTYARLLAATPSLRTSWLLSVLLVVTFAVATGRGTERDLVFLLVAPLVPVAGVAAAYGPRIDAAYEIAVAAPFGGLRLLLLRSVAVLSASVVLCGAAGVFVPGVDGVEWLLPALALSVATLALTTATTPPVAAAAVGLAWVTYVRFRVADPADGLTQVLAAGLLAVALVVLALRAGRIEVGERA